LIFDRTDDGLLLRGQSLRVMSDVHDVRGTLLLDLPRETEQLIQLELTVNASKDALADLLPRALDAEVSDFLTRAIEDVEVRQGRISYSGPLGTDVDRSRRELSMRFPMTSYRFKPLKAWPTFVGTQGVVDFVSKRGRVEFLGPDFGGLAVSRVVAKQDKDNGRRIHITGQVSGEATDVLAILDEAQIKPDTLGSEVILDGRLRGDVSLTVPIGERPEGQVVIEADDLTVALSELSEPFTQVNGRATYRLDDGLYAERLSGNLLGDPVEAKVTVSGGQTDFAGQARLKTSNLSDLISLGFDESQLFGEAEWSIRGRGNDQGFQLSIETDGQGLGSRLPHPLFKETDQVGDIQVSLTSSPELKSFNARFFDATEIRGDLGTNPLVLEIITPEVGIIDWATVPARDGGGPNLSILLKTERLVLGDTPLQVDETAIILKPDEFDVSFDGSEMSGRVWRIGKGSLFIDLTHLVLPEGGDLLDPPDGDPLFDYDPGQLPSANIQVNQLKRGETDYQDMNIVLVSGDSRLDATTLEFTRDGQKYQGELAWVFENGRAKSALLLRAQGADLGHILRVNEDEPLLEAASGRFVSNLTWEGSPLGFSVLTSEGLVELSLEDGRFVDLGNSAEVLRLFGILNIETITRRLRLDVLDLVQPGVAFDRVSAKAKILDGSLRFEPEFEMTGPSSSFRMTGTADLVNRQLNQKLEVDIPLTNNLPLASILLGAPQVGGAIYLVEKALGTKIIKVGKTNYRIEGSFDDPQVVLISPFSKKKDNVNAETPANRQ
ncbi:MAG: YhdP family protein, partial [Litorivicinaceae bacterium]